MVPFVTKKELDDDLGPAWAGLVALGILIIVLVLIYYFAWTLYQLVVLGAT
jgi:hypothetical protein